MLGRPAVSKSRSSLSFTMLAGLLFSVTHFTSLALHDIYQCPNEYATTSILTGLQDWCAIYENREPVSALGEQSLQKSSRSDLCRHLSQHCEPRLPQNIAWRDVGGWL